MQYLVGLLVCILFVGSLVYLLATYPLLTLPDAVRNSVVGLLVCILFVHIGQILDPDPNSMYLDPQHW